MLTNLKINRCGWCQDKPLYIAYHDNEWGKLITADKALFEFMVLESAQAGLSWWTILQKRAGYQQAFADFDVHKVANFTEQQQQQLLNCANIVRNKLKITATVTNAQAFVRVQQEFASFYNYLRSFIRNQTVPIVNHWQQLSEVPAKSELSATISADMKKRGFKFFGPTICYAYLQATGFVNDHLVDCSFK